MLSTFPKIVKYTPAVLQAAAAQNAMSIDEYRLGTLKRCQCELGNLIESADLNPDEIIVINDLYSQIRCSIGDE